MTLPAWRDATPIRLRDQGTAANAESPTIRRISEEIYVAYDPADSSRALAIKAVSGEIGRQLDDSVAMGIDAETGRIISAICTERYVCSVYSTDLVGRDKQLVKKIPFRVADLQAIGGTIFILAKSPSAAWHIPQPFLALAGHPVSYDDLSMIEIDLKTGAIGTSVLFKDLKNAGAYFPMKWREQQVKSVNPAS